MNTIILLYAASYALAWIVVEATIFSEPETGSWILIQNIFIIKLQQLLVVFTA